jgi:hypothetical protein
MKIAADIDLGLLKFLTTPLSLPANLGALGQLAEMGKKHVLEIMSHAADEGVLPAEVLLVQVIHIRPDHVDFGSPTIVRHNQHRKFLAADVVHALGVERNTQKSFFKKASGHNVGGGVVALISKKPSKCNFSALDSNLLHMILNNPASVDEGALNFQPSSNEGEWIAIESFWEILKSNRDSFEAEFQRLSTLPEVDFRKQSKDDDALAPGMEVLCEEDYLRHFSPLVACGDVLLCAPTIYLRANIGADAPAIGGGGCMFILSKTPTTASIRRLYLFSHKIISTVWAYQDLVRIAAETTLQKPAERNIRHHTEQEGQRGFR